MPADKSPVTVRGAASTPTLLKKTKRTSENTQQQLLALPEVAGPKASVPETPTPVVPVVPAKAKQLWLCLSLPRLSLEAIEWGETPDACAVFVEQHGIRRILQADEVAAAAGVHAGMSVNAALSLQPELRLEARNLLCEMRLMKRLAVWAGRFTSFVILEPQGIVLLEIAGSRRLFGEPAAIRQQVVRGIKARGLTVSVAMAPTPLASTWFARSGGDGGVTDTSQLVSRLSRVPIAHLAWPDKVTHALSKMGISHIGDCLRLPRSGFARRFGAFYLQQLDQALGRLPDPRAAHRVPELFCADYELDAESCDSKRLLAACRELLEQLEKFLRVRQQQIQRILFSFFHLDAPATHLTLGCMEAGQDIEQWLELLGIKFDALELPEAVIAIRLRGGQGQLSPLATGCLEFSRAESRRNRSIASLLERFHARMGVASVYGVGVVADHRPHLAWQPVCLSENLSVAEKMPKASTADWRQPAEQSLQRMFLYRPLWVLSEPERLASQGSGPCYDEAPLCLLDGPERLESGWWDNQGIARDYFIAQTAAGSRLWVYRDRRSRHGPDEWYLHGLFA